MDDNTIVAFLAIGAVVFIGFFGNLIFKRYKVPDVLLLVFVGILLGPTILGGRLHLLTTETLDEFNNYRDLFLSVALVMILFDGGLTLDIRAVFESMRLSLFMAVVTFLLTAMAVAAVIYIAIGGSIYIALSLGAIVGGTSGAIVIPIACRLRIKPSTRSILVVESALTDVLVILAAITLLTIVRVGEFDAMNLAGDLAFDFLGGALIGFGVGVLWLYALQLLQRQPLAYMLTIAVLFLVAGAVELVGSSGAIAALALGLSIGNRGFVKRQISSVYLSGGYDDRIQRFHAEITFFIRTFFFVYMGLLFEFGSIDGLQLTVGIAMLCVIVAVRWITSSATSRIGILPKEDSSALFALMPRGLAAAVLATGAAALLVGAPDLPQDLDLTALFLNTTLIVILGTTIIATVLSFRTEKAIDKRKRLELREAS
ncbi:MAG: cation:proton antiporter [Thermoplasmatota archaeon]|nr:cation:proton antiporter [Candidatus Thermoplasmatota archaeon]MBU1915101.1 cation:proton antiporter [Candidatus Thermoplasmatota archaeon]